MPKHERRLQGSPYCLSQQSISIWWLRMRHGRKKLKGKFSKVGGVEPPPLKHCKALRSSSPPQVSVLSQARELFWVGTQGYLVHKAQASVDILPVDQLGQGLRHGPAEEEFPPGDKQTRTGLGCFGLPLQVCQAFTSRSQTPQTLSGFNPQLCTLSYSIATEQMQ